MVTRRPIKIFTQSSTGLLILQHVPTTANLVINNKTGQYTVTGDLNAVQQHGPLQAFKDYAGFLGIYNNHSGKDNYLLMIDSCVSIGSVNDAEVFQINSIVPIPVNQEHVGRGVPPKGLVEIIQLYSSGTFYFTNNPKKFNLSKYGVNGSIDFNLSTQFIWNRIFFSKFDLSENTNLFITHVVAGSIRIKPVWLGQHKATLALISRLSVNRAGTRFKTRGVDDNGHVANFVETEQLLVYPDGSKSSFIQIRGSIPVFWGQPGFNYGQHDIVFTRKNPLVQEDRECNKRAVKKHLMNLDKVYPGRKFVILDLVKQSVGTGEAELSKEFKECLRLVDFDARNHIIHDFHAATDKIAEMQHVLHKNPQMLDQNNFIVRTNCIDCLDRTNAAQREIGMSALMQQMANRKLEPGKIQAFQHEIKQMWLNNGDNLSLLYAGTAAMGTGSKLQELSKSVTRTINNNFHDAGKETAYKILTGETTEPRLLPKMRELSQNWQFQHKKCLEILGAQDSKFTLDRRLRIAVGTFNVNATSKFDKIDLNAWLNWHNLGNDGFDLYRAVYPFGENKGDLFFQPGDKIKVKKGEYINQEEWMTGSSNGKSGIFPVSYTEKIIPTYHAIYDFTAQTAEDLNFLSGDEIIITEKQHPEWWRGYVSTDPVKKVGIFPCSYVQSNDCEDGSDDLDISSAPDIIALGFQEICDLNAKNIVKSGVTASQNWLKIVNDHFEELGEYSFIQHEQLVGVALFLFVRNHLLDVTVSFGNIYQNTEKADINTPILS